MTILYCIYIASVNNIIDYYYCIVNPNFIHLTRRKIDNMLCKKKKLLKTESHLKPRIPLPSPISRPSKVASGNSDEEQQHLEKEPSPAAALLLLGILDMAPVPVYAGRSTTVAGFHAAAAAAADAVQILGLERNDVVVVAKFAGLSGETQVSDRGNGNVGFLGIEFEARDPAVFGLVLEVEG